MKNYLGVLCVALVATSVGCYFLMQQSHWIESNYAAIIYPYISSFFAYSLAWIPISVGDFLYVTMIVGMVVLLYGLVQSIFTRRSIIHSLLRVVNFGLIIWLWFYVGWGFNYFRVPIENRESLPVEVIRAADFVEITYEYLDSLVYYYDQVKESRPLVTESIPSEANQLWQAYLKNNHPEKFTSFQQLSIKPSLFGRGMSKIGISGYFNPFTHEAHVNEDQPVINQPFTAVHELAHVAGISLENEANFYAFILSVKSTDPHFRYAAYFEAFWSLVFQLYYIDPSLYESFMQKIPQGILEDRNEVVEYWQQQTGWMHDITSWFYERLLRANNQPAGLQTYGQFTTLLVANRLKGTNCR